MRTKTPSRSRSFAFRLSLADAEALETRAEAIGIAPSEYVRRLVQLWLNLPEPMPERWTRAARQPADREATP